MNCRGLKNEQKKNDVLDYLKNTDSNIICLQDTHWVSEDSRNIRSIWNNPCYIHGSKTNARGVAILINKNFEHKVLNMINDEVGNFLLLDIKINNDVTVRLINIYAPNKDTPAFFNKLNEYIQSNECDYTIICGDLNLTLDPKLDSMNYVNINNPRSRLTVHNMINAHELLDAFRYLHKDVKRYTWRKKNPIKQARLDYFLISNTMTDLMTECNICPGYRTDHSLIKLKLVINPFIRGKGTWKFNCNLLKNQNYILLVNRIIELEKQKYALPVYNNDNINEIADEKLQLTISDQTFLEMLLLSIRGRTIKFSSKQKNNDNKREAQLMNEIEDLENNNIYNDVSENKKIELQELRNVQLKGKMIRSRTQWLDEGERPTKYFCALENHNFMNKTIKKLKVSENTTLTEQKSILAQIKKFYENLFSNQDDKDGTKLDDTFADLNANKLTEQESNSIEGLLTLPELSKALKHMQNNKTPGLDGFPADFYKFFWLKLRFFVLRAINESFTRKEMSITMKQCVITCLPKGDKAREEIKNWRPISLLNVSYKLASAAIANRLKNVLNSIIAKTQTGFLQNRFIGECTRLIYDIMNNCENKNIDGLLMLIDFEKAFDSVSWKFLYKTLNFFNFGEDIISWIKVFNNDITAYIMQCGFLSEPFKIQRGCRQGDPIASYLFLLCGQILYLLVEKNKDIKGITINNDTYTISQFADDTTLLLDGTQKSLQAALNELEIFGNLSGLKMNKDKTKVIWIGRKKFSKDKLKTTPQLTWGDTTFTLLGLTYSVNLVEMIPLNYDKYIKQTNEIIKHWNKRYLTPLGKITVIKTFIFSKFIHLFTTLPSPGPNITDSINKMIYKFLWDNKPDKIARKLTIQTNLDGGLNMKNIATFIQALKVTWMRRLLNSDDQPWVNLFEATISPIRKIFDLGPNYASTISKSITNPFWKETLLSWGEYAKLSQPKTPQEILSSPIWHNTEISNITQYIPNWYFKGITSIGDIIKPDGTIMSIREITQTYGVAQINFLEFHRIKTLAQKYLSKLQPNTNIQLENQKPNIPFQYSILLKIKSGASDIYKVLSTKHKLNYSNNKWEGALQIQITPQDWNNIFKICFHIIKDNYLVWMQYKIINRILGNKYYLHKLNIVNSPNCNLCNLHPETLTHLFYECRTVNNLWNNLSDWITQKIRITVNFNTTMIILGYLEKDENYIPLNSIILITKSYIFWSSRNKIQTNINTLQDRIKNTYLDQKFIHTKNGKEDNFLSKWNYWSNLI